MLLRADSVEDSVVGSVDLLKDSEFSGGFCKFYKFCRFCETCRFLKESLKNLVKDSVVNSIPGGAE